MILYDTNARAGTSTVQEYIVNTVRICIILLQAQDVTYGLNKRKRPTDTELAMAEDQQKPRGESFIQANRNNGRKFDRREEERRFKVPVALL